MEGLSLSLVYSLLILWLVFLSLSALWSSDPSLSRGNSAGNEVVKKRKTVKNAVIIPPNVDSGREIQARKRVYNRRKRPRSSPNRDLARNRRTGNPGFNAIDEIQGREEVEREENLGIVKPSPVFGRNQVLGTTGSNLSTDIRLNRRRKSAFRRVAASNAGIHVVAGKIEGINWSVPEPPDFASMRIPTLLKSPKTGSLMPLWSLHPRDYSPFLGN